MAQTCREQRVEGCGGPPEAGRGWRGVAAPQKLAEARTRSPPEPPEGVGPLRLDLGLGKPPWDFWPLER